MTDLAGDWLASLPDTSTDSYANIKQAFDARYKVPEMVKYKSAKDLFSRKQQQSESVDDFCAGLQKAARIIGADEKTTVYAALNGISPSLVGFIAQRKPETMATLLEAARIAELTIPAQKNAQDEVSSQISEVKAEMQKLNEKWERVAVNAARNDGGDKHQRSVSFQRSSTPPPHRNDYSNHFRPTRFTSDVRAFGGRPMMRQQGYMYRFRSPRPMATFPAPRMRMQSPAAYQYYGGAAMAMGPPILMQQPPQNGRYGNPVNQSQYDHNTGVKFPLVANAEGQPMLIHSTVRR